LGPTSDADVRGRKAGGILALLQYSRVAGGRAATKAVAGMRESRYLARDRIPTPTLGLQPFGEEHLQQRLIGDIALVGQKL